MRFPKQCPLLPSVIAMHFVKLMYFEPNMPSSTKLSRPTFLAQDKRRTDEIDLARDSVVNIYDLFWRLPIGARTSND